MNWFNVDKAGLGKLLQRRGSAWPLFELLSNAFDTAARRVELNVKPIPGVAKVTVEVIDDSPLGFQNLEHAYTLFAESNRKGDAEKRGRFNLGEKITLALCDRATIESTTGSIVFDAEGRHRSRRNTETGSRFLGVMPMTREKMEEALTAVRRLIQPSFVEVLINNEVLPDRVQVGSISGVTLATEIADEEGVLRRTKRQTELHVYEVLPGERAMLYEMGIPVVETGDRWHINVMQKVPLSFERDNVTAAYLQAVRTAVVNELSRLLTKEDATQPWVRDAAGSADINEAATGVVTSLRFGEKRVINDPSDPEATSIAMAEGYTVIHGGMLSPAEWEQVRRANAALPAGRVTPSPKPFREDAEPLKMLAREMWTDSIKRVVAFAQEAGRDLTGQVTTVDVANDNGWRFRACYSPGRLTLNLGRLGRRWFENWPLNDDVEGLLIHEFAHGEPGGDNHLSHEYHAALCRMGARLTMLALRRPDLWK